MGMHPKASQYLQYAAENALRRSATREAVDLLTHGLMLLRKAPENPQRAQQEQRLQIMLGTLLVSTKGAVASEIEQSRRQVQELRQAIGETRPLFPVLCGLWAAHFAAADLSEACKCGEQLLRLAKRERDATLQLSAHYLLGTSFTFRGEFVEAQQHLQHARSLFDRQEHEFLTFFHEEDPEVLCLSLEAFVLWHLGYPDRALAKSQQAVSLAHSFAHPASVAQAMTVAALLERLRRDTEETQDDQNLQATALPESELAGFFTNGYSQRTPRLQSGFTAIQLTGGKLLRPYALAVVANTYGEVGQSEEGLAVLDEAFAQVQTSGEGWWEAELYRLKGELLLQRKRG